MTTTDKAACRMIADLLVAHGVRKAVLCPGSRNAPLIVAFSRHAGLQTQVVIDERSAAFVALGMSLVGQEPVAVVCTSGSAVLNFAPAVAEAFYRRVPLIVISADRPLEWIDQDDSQTIRQIGILANIVKNSYNVPVETGDATQAWYINRTVNDALLLATDGPQGPVHINVQLDAPLGGECDSRDPEPRAIRALKPDGRFHTSRIRQLAQTIASPRKVLIICGFMPPSDKVNRALARLSAHPNVALMREAQANVHAGADCIRGIDSVLSVMSPEEKREMLPDVVVTLGGSLVSRFVKAWLRPAEHIEHWHVGTQPYSVDCFKHLSLRIETEERDFLPQLASALQPYNAPCDYAAQWRRLAARASACDKAYEAVAPWSDYKAMAMIMRQSPAGINLQLSNGTAVRYAQLFDYDRFHRIDCNRGVSGIDGCTSTAIGAALAFSGTTLLVTGDMSAQYDLGALAATCLPTRLKIAVLNNSGGGIFRFIESTASLPERDECFCATVRLPLRQLAEGFGFDYYRAQSEQELAECFPRFFAQSTRPAILDIVTPPAESADVLRRYFTRFAQN